MSSDGDHSAEVQRLTSEVSRLSGTVGLWNTAIIVMMVLAALAATGLVVTQYIAFRRAGQLSAAQAQLDAAKDRESSEAIAAAKSIASRADLKRAELQKKMVDIFGARQLTAEQSQRIAKKLAGLSGVKIDVYAFAVENPYVPNSSPDDSSKIASAVVNILRSARIDAEGWVLGSCDSGASNVVVSVTGKGAEERKIASRLIDAFGPEIGTDPEIGKDPPLACARFSNLDRHRPNKRKHDAAISITIGSQVNPVLTPEMLEADDESVRKP